MAISRWFGLGRRVRCSTGLTSDHDTGAFAVASIPGWWRAEGRRLYQARRLLNSGIAVWYKSSWPPVTIRWVLVRDPQCKFETRAILLSQEL